MSSFLWLRPFPHRWFGRRWRRVSSTRPDVSSRRRVRPWLETLEDRITPTQFTPTTFADDGTVNSLRGAITQANNDTGTATDTIQLAAGTYKLTIANTANNHDVSNTQGDLNITSTAHALVIQGAADANGKPTTIIDQTTADRVFQIVNAGSTVTFKDVVIEGGKAQDDGTAGAVAGSTVAEGGGILDKGGNVTLDNVVVQHNEAVGGDDKQARGGGIYALNGDLTVHNSVVQNNAALGGTGVSASPNGREGFGGGIELDATTPSQFTLINSTVASNHVVGGNGYSTSTGGIGGDGVGGGIADQLLAATTVVITDSTIAGNSAESGTATGTATGPSHAQGGGIAFAASNGTTLQLVNSTVAENTLESQGPDPHSLGGGVDLFDGAATFTNVTVADNTVGILQGSSGTTQGGGIVAESAAVVNLVNTLVALNSAATGLDYSGAVSSSSHNLIGNADGSSGFDASHGDLLGSTASPLDPHLGPLANNGGPTQTLALLPGSPALNAGDNNALSVTGPFDQRGSGFARVASGAIDIGAFELQPPSSPPSGGGGAMAPHPSLFQALLSLYIDGAALEATQLANEFIYGPNFNIDNYFGSPSQLAVVRANAAAAGINYDTVLSLSNFLSTLRSFYTIQPDIAANVPYAGPFAEFAVIAGVQAVDQAVRHS